MLVYVCLLASMLYLHVAYLDLGFDMLFALRGFVHVGLWAHLLAWLHPPLLWLIGCDHL